jgi:hypothetical protein
MVCECICVYVFACVRVSIYLRACVCVHECMLCVNVDVRVLYVYMCVRVGKVQCIWTGRSFLDP